MSVYANSELLFQTFDNTVVTQLTTANGTQDIVINAWDAHGNVYEASATIDVTSQQPANIACKPPGEANESVHVCSPTTGQTSVSPLLVSAASVSTSSPVTATRVYVDNQSTVTTFGVNASYLNATIALSDGKHDVEVQAWNATGAVFKAPAITVTIESVPPPSNEAFNAVWFVGFGETTPVGTLALDENGPTGAGSVHLTGAAKSTSYQLQFCPFPIGYQNCMQVSTISSDQNGNVTEDFQFPFVGTWAGAFLLTEDGTVQFTATFPVPSIGTQWRIALQRATTLSGRTGALAGAGNDPLSSGALSITGASLNIVVNGAVPNGDYTVTYCANSDSSSCFQIGTFTTDSRGDVNTAIPVGTYNLAGVFLIYRGSSTEYYGAFRVQ